MYQRLLQEGLERQLTLRKQMEELMKQKFQQQQQLANELFGQRQQHQQPTNGPTNPTTEPRPIPPPPITEHPTTPMPPQDTFSVEHGTLPPVDMGEPSEEVGSDGMSWSDGIVGDHQTSNGQQQPQNTFGNGPASFPGFSQPGTLNLRRWRASKQKTESLVNQCMSQSGITTPLPQILESQDIEVFKTSVKSPVVGPCIMTQAETTFGQDRAGLIGRQMLQSVLMFLGQLCSRLESMEAAAAAGHGGMTSEPVFPNSPPPMGVSEITTVVPEAPLPVKVNEEIVKKSEQPKLAPTSTSDAKQTNPQDPATKANAQVREKEVKVVEAAFPMWMILAMVGGCAALLLIGCLATCLCLRCRRKKKTVELDREPEKLPVPSTQNNFYAASPFVPPPQYPTTAVKQTLGGEEEEEEEEGAKVKAEAKSDVEGDAGSRSS
nr:hypothetical protein BaRGS_010067 [Batillaria attramentaria]